MEIFKKMLYYLQMATRRNVTNDFRIHFCGVVNTRIHEETG